MKKPSSFSIRVEIFKRNDIAIHKLYEDLTELLKICIS